jgi:predicted DsbA family dithiol-disulfide isomerase
VGKRRFETALAGFDHRDEVELVWRAFELDPRAPAERPLDYVAHLASKYRVSPSQAEAMIERMTGTGAEVGLQLRFDVARPGNTFDAHRLVRLAWERGVQDAVVERFFAATFEEGRPIGERETLVRLAAEAGLDGDEAQAVLDSGAYAEDVRADERRAAELGITAVPFAAIDEGYGIAGAQPPDVIGRILAEVWVETRSGAAAPG